MTLLVSYIVKGPEVGKNVNLTRLPPTDCRGWKTLQLECLGFFYFFKQACVDFPHSKKCR